jgi:IS5 family transposase
MENAHLQIRGIKKTDEGMYTCEARVMARGEIDFRAIKVVINGERSTHTHVCTQARAHTHTPPHSLLLPVPSQIRI